MQGSKLTVYAKQHAEDGMVNDRNKRCSHGFCLKRASLKIEGSKTSVYCKQHSVDGMLNDHSRGFSDNKEPIRASSSRARRRLTDGTDGTAAKRVCQAMPGSIIPVAEEHLYIRAPHQGGNERVRYTLDRRARTIALLWSPPMCVGFLADLGFNRSPFMFFQYGDVVTVILYDGDDTTPTK